MCVSDTVELIAYVLSTATARRSALPPLTDTLLVADRLRAVAMSLHGTPSPALSGHEADGTPRQGHHHAFWWPMDEDNDGFVDHVYVVARGGFQVGEVAALRRLNRLRQRGGRPEVFVTPTFVGRITDYAPWQAQARTFVSATPYFCPLYLSHGRAAGRLRSLHQVVCEGLQAQGLIREIAEVESIAELAFDSNLAATSAADTGEPPSAQQCLATPAGKWKNYSPLYPRVCRKNPDEGYPSSLSVGLYVNHGKRFIPAHAFYRNRRGRRVKGYGRMLEIVFQQPRSAQPFTLGSECHFGLGLFVPVLNDPPVSSGALIRRA